MVYISRLCEPISEFCFGRNVVQCITEMGYSYTGVHLDLFWTICLPKNAHTKTPSFARALQTQIIHEHDKKTITNFSKLSTYMPLCPNTSSIIQLA